MKINTVLGKIDEKEIGNCLIHEHLTFADRNLRIAFGDKFFDPKIVEEAAILQFNAAKKAGVTTIVDGSAINLGRDVNLLKKISEKTGINILVSTGFYYQNEIYLEMESEDTIYNFIIKEVENGIEQTNIYPAILKIACGPNGINEITKKVFCAIGRVAATKNMPIFCHHYPLTKNAHEIINILENVGVKPHQLIIGHSGDTNDIEYLESIAKKGYYLGLDRFGYCKVSNNFENRIDTIVKLCNLGYEKQILLSHDLAVFSGIIEPMESFKKKYQELPETGFDFIHKNVIPELIKKGVTKEKIEIIMNKNPIRFLTCSKID